MFVGGLGIPTGIDPAAPLASSVAGALGQDPHLGETKAEASARKFAADLRVAAARVVEDITASNESDERDADGALAYPREADGDADPREPEQRPPPAASPVPDADGECGARLDVQA